jgi:hypothetical protein
VLLGGAPNVADKDKMFSSGVRLSCFVGEADIEKFYFICLLDLERRGIVQMECEIGEESESRGIWIPGAAPA